MSTEVVTTPKVDVGVDPINTALVAAGVTSARIEQLSKYDELLVLPDPTTQEEADVFKLAQFECRDLRNAAVSTLKALRDPHIRMQKLIVGEENRIVATIDKYEGPLKTKRDAYAKMLEQRMAEDVARHKAKNDARKERMATIGFRFNPLSKEYELPGFASIDEEGVSGINVDDLQFAEWLLDLEKQVAEHKEREEEKQRTAKIAADALAKDQWAKELAAKLEAERIAEAQAELERKQKDMEAREAAMNQKVNEVRKNELVAIGMRQGQYSDCVFLTREGGGYTYPTEQLHGFDEWEAEKTSLRPLIQGRDNQEREDRLRAEAERAAREKQLQDKAAKKAVDDERIRVATEMKARLEKEAREAQQKAERLLKLDDKEKVIAFGQKLGLLSAEIPELKSAVGQHAMRTLNKQINDIIIMLARLDL